MSLRVIYVDDEPDMCQMFVDNFSTPEIQIQTYVDSQIALEAIHQNPPDLVILDYRLRDTTGDLLAKEIKVKLPIALLTGDLEVETDFEFSRCFRKQPFPWDEIQGFLVQAKNDAAKRK